MNTFVKLALVLMIILVLGEFWKLRIAESTAEDKAGAEAIATLFATRRAEANRPAPAVYRDKEGRIIQKYEYELMTGYDAAKERGIANHDDCGKMEGLERNGCDRYVTEQKIPPHIDQADYSSDKTTAQCEAEVNAHYDALIQDLRELGVASGDSSLTGAHKSRFEERKQCQAYDFLAASRRASTQ